MTETALLGDELYRAVADAERSLGELRRTLDHARKPHRELAKEIEAALTIHGPSTVPELGRAIRARQDDVRRVLREHPGRFQCAQNVPGRSPKAKCWINAAVASRTGPDTSDESLEVRGGLRRPR